MGYSSRYGSRLGMGRFGVGAKLGGISQAQRIELYSRESADEPWLFTYIDLEDIGNGMDVIPEPVEVELPEEYLDLVGPEAGTLVVWAKTDKLQERETGGARQASPLERDLLAYGSRTFRKFLDAGKQITINDVKVLPHDPLFLMTTTRFHQPPEKRTSNWRIFRLRFGSPASCADRIFYEAKSKILSFRGVMSDQHRDHLLGFAETEVFRDAVVALFGPGADDEAVEKSIDDFREAVEEIFERSNPDPIATVLHPESFEFPIPNKPGQTSPVEVTITLLPEKFWQRQVHRSSRWL